MRVEIFDVDHGQCAAITAPNGRAILVDCGDRMEGTRWWAPSMHFLNSRFDLLALTNLDEDHLSNFHLLTQYVSIGAILTNPTIGGAQLLGLKPHGMKAGTRGVYDWLSIPYKPTVPFPDFDDVKVSWCCNPYIPGASNDTNNLSLVLIVEYRGFKIVFGGDVESAGWRELLARYPRLTFALNGTCIYVASHHGRRNGCSDDLFNLIRPGVVIVSDAKRQYETQDTDAWYRQRCNGIPVIGTSDWRYILSTRKDGSLRIDVNSNGSWVVTPFDTGTWNLNNASVA